MTLENNLVHLEKDGIKVKGDVTPYADVIPPEAVRFLASLEREFGSGRRKNLMYRELRQHDYNNGQLPGFLQDDHHKGIRESEWQVAPIPQDLEKRWVEITGPASNRKMVINALNSGTDTYMADAEDSESPTWKNILKGQANLKDSVRGEVDFTEESSGKHYELQENHATLLFRPRGWHLEEHNVLVDGQPMSASLFDAGLYIFLNAKKLVEKGSGPYLYLPKMESHQETKLWDQVFKKAEAELGLENGTVKATALIETLPAVFEMEEMLHSMKDHFVGLNCGRWDYIFSYIKTLGEHPLALLPDRSQVTMDKGFLEAYATHLIQTCHKRGAHAMGGMAAQIPVKGDKASEHAYKLFKRGSWDQVWEMYPNTWVGKVLADKCREADLGHDGTWIAHPGLKEIATTVFEQRMDGSPHQKHVLPEEHISAQKLLIPISGEVTYDGFYTNMRVGIEYLAAWLEGNGCVPLNNLMEDAATAEISRTQIWQWLKHGAYLDDGRKVDRSLFDETWKQVKRDIKEGVGNQNYRKGNYVKAAELFKDMSKARECPNFLTIPAYEELQK